MLLLIGSGAVAVLLASTVFYVMMIKHLRLAYENDLRGLVQIIARNSEVPVAFRIPEEAERVLVSLSERPSVIRAVILDQSGKVFADYEKVPVSPQLPVNHIKVSRPIEMGGKVIGSLVIYDDLRGIKDARLVAGTMMLFAVLIAMCVAFLTVPLAQRPISRPIIALSSVAERISRERDYSLRAEKYGEDEVGQLADDFNAMIEQTERRNSELLASEERLKGIIKSFDGLLYICTKDYRIDFMNEFLIRRTGRDAVGEVCYEVMYGRTSVCPWCGNERVFKGETIRFEVLSPVDDRWYYVVNVPIYDPDGEVRYNISTGFDVTERKRAESEVRRNQKMLQKSLQEWQYTFDSITDMICIVDRDCSIIKANKAFADYVNSSTDNVAGKKCFELVCGEDHPCKGCPHSETMLKRMNVSTEFSIDGGDKVLQVSSFPHYLSEGECAGSICIVRDITDERKNELRLIINERLALLGQVASGIAHEINNPLASIGGCAQGLLDRLDKNDCDLALFRSYLGIICEEVFRCKNITTEMLSFVRTSEMMEDVDITNLLVKTLELIGFQGRLHKIKIVTDYARELPRVKGSEGELKQVFMVVITNAIDAMHENGVLSVSTALTGGNIVIVISDTGSGIPQKYMDKIFEPFFTTKGGSGGTGLGLSIAQRIVLNHGGQIRLAPATPRGTVVTIVLPLQRPPGEVADTTKGNCGCSG